ncbi:methenyltetrahydrofolate synthase domain-containing protein-like [Oppia nitens]|uniref:methenyltetrahydrofolate synthase domain-containing protein-like n=1 Tax=Oppia nitens TaxID=1686743 RepID=UPI0023DB164D|nr:methenyltetrahydrofolate synthase domain-containing protein-like [Oppia nitens]
MTTKAAIRHKVWSYLEDNDLALPPRPVFDRIPNFKNSDIACDRVVKQKEFINARVVKINPDRPQLKARYRTLESRKTLLVPTPRLTSGLFNEIIVSDYSKEALRTCASSEGVRNFSKPIDLQSKITIDVIIVGSVAVSMQGHRIGKGEGFADLEYAMMVSLGVIDPLNTPVITTVDDSQVFDSLPENLFGEHDLTVDIIATPTRLIRCEPRLSKPKGIIWSLLTPQRLDEMPILKTFKDWEKDNKKTGKNVHLVSN